MNRLSRRYLGALVVSVLFAGTTFAQDAFPSRPVTLVVPVGTGGGTDLVARQLAKMLSSQWRQPVVVDNKPGAAGLIGANMVIKSVPDGYNLLLVWDGPIVATPVLFNRPDYDPFNQLVPISQVLVQQHRRVKLNVLEVVLFVVNEAQLITDHLIEPTGSVIVKSQVPSSEYRMPLGVRNQYWVCFCCHHSSGFQLGNTVAPD